MPPLPRAIDVLNTFYFPRSERHFTAFHHPTPPNPPVDSGLGVDSNGLQLDRSASVAEGWNPGHGRRHCRPPLGSHRHHPTRRLKLHRYLQLWALTESNRRNSIPPVVRLLNPWAGGRSRSACSIHSSPRPHSTRLLDRHTTGHRLAESRFGRNPDRHGAFPYTPCSTGSKGKRVPGRVN